MRSGRGGGEGGSWRREAPPGCPGRGVPPPAPGPERDGDRPGRRPLAPLARAPARPAAGGGGGRGRLRARDDPSRDANAPPPGPRRPAAPEAAAPPPAGATEGPGWAEGEGARARARTSENFRREERVAERAREQGVWKKLGKHEPKDRATEKENVSTHTHEH